MSRCGRNLGELGPSAKGSALGLIRDDLPDSPCLTSWASFVQGERTLASTVDQVVSPLCLRGRGVPFSQPGAS